MMKYILQTLLKIKILICMPSVIGQQRWDTLIVSIYANSVDIY